MLKDEDSDLRYILEFNFCFSFRSGSKSILLPSICFFLRHTISNPIEYWRVGI